MKKLVFAFFLSILFSPSAYPCSQLSPWIGNSSIPENTGDIISGEIIPHLAATRPPRDSTAFGCEDSGGLYVFIEPGMLAIKPGEHLYTIVYILENKYIAGTHPPQRLRNTSLLSNNSVRLSWPTNGQTHDNSNFDVVVTLTVVDRQGRYSKPSQPFRLFYDESQGTEIIRYKEHERLLNEQDSLIKMIRSITHLVLDDRYSLLSLYGSEEYIVLTDNEMESINQRGREIRVLLDDVEDTVKKMEKVERWNVPLESLLPGYMEYKEHIIRYVAASGMLTIYPFMRDQQVELKFFDNVFNSLIPSGIDNYSTELQRLEKQLLTSL